MSSDGASVGYRHEASPWRLIGVVHECTLHRSRASRRIAAAAGAPGPAGNKTLSRSRAIARRHRLASTVASSLRPATTPRRPASMAWVSPESTTRRAASP